MVIEKKKKNKVKLHTLRRQNQLLGSRTGQSYEGLQGADFISTSGRQNIDGFVTIIWSYIVVAFEESKDLNTVKIEELQHFLEEYEMRINEGTSTQELELQARSNYKGKGKGS